MKIAEWKDAMEFFRNSKQEESNGKWKEFVEKSRFDDMLQEPRTMAQGPRVGYDEGQLVTPSVDGSRPGYQGKSHWIYEVGSNNKKLKKEVVEDITTMMADAENFPDKQTITKRFKYKGNPDKVLKMWAEETGNKIPEERFRLHTYEGTTIQKNLVKAFEAQGDNPNIMKLAREFFPETYKKKKTSATQQVRRILTEFADYVPRPNEPIPPGGEGYWKKRRKNINLALKRMGDTTIGEQMADQIWKENQQWIKLANENPDAILKNKKLTDALNLTVDVDTGEFINRKLTNNEILERVKRGDLFTEDHITEVGQVETAPKKGGGTKLIKGHVVEYPINKQSVTTFWNQSFLPNAKKYIAANPDGKNVKAIVKILDDYGLKLQVGDKTYGSTAEKVAWNSKTNLSPRLKSNFDVFKPSFAETIRPKGSGVQLSSVGKAFKKGWRGFRKVGGPWEAGFIGLDFINNLDTMDANTAFQTALSNATLGMYEGGKRAQWEDFETAGKELGHNPENLNEIKSIMDLEKMMAGEKQILEEMIAYNQTDPKTHFPEEEIKWRKDVVARLEKEFENKQNTFWSQDNAQDLVGNYQDTVGYVARKDYNKNLNREGAGKMFFGDKERRVNPDMNVIGSPLWQVITDWKDYVPQSFLPQNFLQNYLTKAIPNTLRKLPGVLGDVWEPTSERAKLYDMSEEEIDQRAKDLNIQEQYYHPVTGNTMTQAQMEPYYEKYYAGGGIADIRRPNAIPPESGPTPYGLPSMLNRVKKW